MAYSVSDFQSALDTRGIAGDEANSLMKNFKEGSIIKLVPLKTTEAMKLKREGKRISYEVINQTGYCGTCMTSTMMVRAYSILMGAGAFVQGYCDICNSSIMTKER